MKSPGELPALRDGNLRVADLERFARTFDALSAEDEARYSAAAFVRWVRLEATDGYNAPAGRPGQMGSRSPARSP